MTRSVLLALALLVAPAFPAAAGDDVAEAPSCRYCGMDRRTFDATRMVVTWDDGSSVGTCSLHCAAVELALQIDKTPASIQVADLGTRGLVDAEKATWVVGGRKPGVMTRRGKWAFRDRAAAEAFAKENGGTLASFEEAMKAAYEDMYADTRMIREKRRAGRARASEPR